MKLHLPKLLRVAVLAVMPVVFAVPAVAKSVDLSTVSGTYSHTGDLTLGEDERMGIQEGTTWKTISNGQSYTGQVTPAVSVTGKLELTSNARVDVGGASGSNYVGLTADSISVQDTAELYAYKVNVRELNVSGGAVQIHYEKGGTAATYGPYGNSGTNYATSGKQVHIKEALTVSNGSVKIGSTQSDWSSYRGTSHILTVFGKGSTTGGAIINQAGGSLDIQGKTATVGNLSIEQTGGTMNVVTVTTWETGDSTSGPRLLVAADSSNTIRQSGSAAGMTMTIGRIQGYSTSSKASILIQQ